MGRILVAYEAFFSHIKQCFPADSVELWDQREFPSNTKLLVLTGGEDISPNIYKENYTYSYGTNNYRDNVELSALKQATLSGVKILGICRGLQLGVAFFGGKLYQDFYYELGVDHKYAHPLNFLAPSKNDIYLDFKIVNSLHHQGLKTVPKEFTVLANYEGIPEIVEGRAFIGVQFHPELLKDKPSQEFFHSVSAWANKSISKITKNKNPSETSPEYSSDFLFDRQQFENVMRERISFGRTNRTSEQLFGGTPVSFEELSSHNDEPEEEFDEDEEEEFDEENN